MRRTLSAIVFAVTVTATTGSLAGADPSAAAPIDRKALVERHNVTFTEVNPAEVPQVGNGEIAFGIDVTGLQTLYGNAFSQWAWHSTLPPVKKPV